MIYSVPKSTSVSGRITSREPILGSKHRRKLKHPAMEITVSSFFDPPLDSRGKVHYSLFSGWRRSQSPHSLTYSPGFSRMTNLRQVYSLPSSRRALIRRTSSISWSHTLPSPTWTRTLIGSKCPVTLRQHCTSIHALVFIPHIPCLHYNFHFLNNIN